MLSSTSELSVRVDKATNHLLIGPDWALNMEICDLVNSNHSQAKDVVKAVKKRIQHKNPRVQFLALTLLETMIKNCGDFVHFQVAEREILQEMVKIVRKKTDIQVRDKILLLLDSWKEAFGGPQGKYPQYYWAYAELKKSGVHFPKNSGASAPIFTPPVVQSVPEHPPMGYGMPTNFSMRLDEAMASEIGNLSLTELNSMRTVMELLDDMLQAVNSNDRDAVKDEVIVDLITQCRSNQKKIIHFVSSTRNEELLAQALEVNDSLQYLIVKHDAIASGCQMPSRTSEPVLRRDPTPSASEAKSEKVSNEEEEEDDDDGFAELARRNSKLKQHMSLSSSVGSCEQEASSNLSVATSGVTSLSKTEASPSTSSNALVVSDYPSPVSTSAKSKEQEIIDLLSLTLSDNPSSSSSYTSTTPPSTLSSLSLVPVFSQTQEYPRSPHPPQNSPLFLVNQSSVPYNNYVAPWAQQTVPQPMWQSQPQYQQQTYNYPLPPWATSSSSNGYNSFPSNHQQFAPHANMAGSYAPVMNASRPLMKYNSFNSEANTPLVSRPLQHYNSFGSRGNSSQGIVGEMQQGTNIRPSVPTSNTPFIPSYRLFEDLIDLRNADGTIKAKNTASSLSSSSSQSLI